MSLLSAIKARALDAADRYTWATEPWDNFTRPLIGTPNYLSSTFAFQENEYFQDLKDFRREGLFLSRIPLPEGSPLDLGDSALWHGIYTAMLAVRWHFVGDGTSEIMLKAALQALGKHQTWHGEAQPRLIRGYDPRYPGWADDASNDTLTGHFFGIWAVLKWGPVELRDEAEQYLKNICDELANYNFCLIDNNKKPTPHGKLINGVLTDPLQYTLVHAIFSALRPYSSRYEFLRQILYKKYKELIPYGKAAFGNYQNWNDDHRAAMHLLVISETDPESKEYVRKGVRRMWRYAKKRANPWVNALLALTETVDRDAFNEMRRQAWMVLGEYDLTARRNEVPVDWREKYKLSPLWNPTVVTVKGIPRSTQPLPLWARGAQDFFFQRCPFSVVDWQGVTEPMSAFNAGDWLCAFWFSRLAGLL